MLHSLIPVGCAAPPKLAPIRLWPTPHALRPNPQGIYEECASVLYEEIDYINEGRNADRCGAARRLRSL
jgi:predicted unusual protein kinase regulating ubiquinone biosynthesis (AarF/ABC1/UbiB family)